MKKVIIFDLYDTVLKDISFDFSNGLNYLYNTFFKSKCSPEAFKAYADTFKPLYDKRKIDNSEICLIKDEVSLYFDKFGVHAPKDLEELDYNIMQQMQKVTLLDKVKYTLEYLHGQGISMYVLSNSIFTGSSNQRLLNDFGIARYFRNVFSSADHGVRKPSPKFYQIAVDKIFADDPSLKVEDILYVGNDYLTDVTGASAMGLKTVWYNVTHAPNHNNIDTIDIDDFVLLTKIVNE